MRRLAAFGLLVLAGCASTGAEPAPYVPDRRDYATFREGFPGVLEPNYLPFMAHRIPQSGGREDVLVFCRWESEDMPLAVFIEPPEIPASLHAEFLPRDPAGFVGAVEAASLAVYVVWTRRLPAAVP